MNHMKNIVPGLPAARTHPERGVAESKDLRLHLVGGSRGIHAPERSSFLF